MPDPPPSLLKEGGAFFEQLVAEVEKPEKRDRPENLWIRQSTWLLVDQRASIRKEGKLDHREARCYSRRIKVARKEDRNHRARWVGKAIMLALEEGNSREAWQILRAWTRKAEGSATKPCYATMDKQAEWREALYAYKASPGEHIPANRERVPLPDEAPDNGEIGAGVKLLKNRRARGGTHMRAEDMKGWLARAEAEEKTERNEVEGLKGAGDTWQMLVRLVRCIWDTGEIPQ